MNRHARRAGQVSGVGDPMANLRSFQETLSKMAPLVEIPQKLQPMLDEAAQLANRLEGSKSTLDALDQVRRGLELQRQVFLRMFAQFAGVSLEEVLSIEAQVREGLRTNADENPGNSDQQPGQEDPSP